MTMTRASLLTALMTLTLAHSLPAEAQRIHGSDMAYTARHLTMPERTLRFDVGPYERGINDSGILNGPFRAQGYGMRLTHIDNVPRDDLWLALGLGMAYGIMDELEIGVLFVPAVLAPESHFGDITTYVRYAFVDGRVFQMGVQGLFNFPTGRTAEDLFGFSVGLPMNINAGGVVRIETGLKLEVLFYGDDDTVASLDLPIAITGRIGRGGFLGGRADLYFFDFNPVTAAVGGHGGVTLFGRRTATDLTAQLLAFVPTDRTRFNWELTFGVNIHLGV